MKYQKKAKSKNDHQIKKHKTSKIWVKNKHTKEEENINKRREYEHMKM